MYQTKLNWRNIKVSRKWKETEPKVLKHWCCGKYYTKEQRKNKVIAYVCQRKCRSLKYTIYSQRITLVCTPRTFHGPSFNLKVPNIIWHVEFSYTNSWTNLIRSFFEIIQFVRRVLLHRLDSKCFSVLDLHLGKNLNLVPNRIVGASSRNGVSTDRSNSQFPCGTSFVHR